MCSDNGETGSRPASDVPWQKKAGSGCKYLLDKDGRLAWSFFRRPHRTLHVGPEAARPDPSRPLGATGARARKAAEDRRTTLSRPPPFDPDCSTLSFPQRVSRTRRFHGLRPMRAFRRAGMHFQRRLCSAFASLRFRPTISPLLCFASLAPLRFRPTLPAVHSRSLPVRRTLSRKSSGRSTFPGCATRFL